MAVNDEVNNDVKEGVNTVEGKTPAQQFWAVVPAAGIGSRMREAAGGIPKQYLEIGGQSILSLTLSRLDAMGGLSGIVVALSEDDNWFSAEDLELDTPLLRASGGEERMHSVCNALEALEDRAAATDWVLVHDAVRPCVSIQDLEKLLGELSTDDTGGLLATPVSETLKRVGADKRVERTEPRENFWLAGTPQMFRYGALKSALTKGIRDGVRITDEAHAMENAGHRVRVVQGSVDNIKITHAGDLVLAEHILNRQSAS